MANVLEMPKLSDTMTEGAIVRWLKKEGEKIAPGLPIVEVETDKSNMEYESPFGGVLLKILVGDGQKCALRAPIAVIGKQDEKWEDALKLFEEKKAAPKASTHAAAQTTEKTQSNTTPHANVQSTLAPTVQNTSVDSTQVKASPLAKKIAADLGINLATVKGSGPNNRVVQRDLDTYKSTARAAPVNASLMQEGVKKVSLTNMRKTIAQRLSQSVNSAPHFYLKISIDMTQMLASRKAMLAQLPPEQKFSVNDLMIYFVSRALLKHPEINSSWQDDHIAEYSHVHMSVAVALPQGGLITPVIRHAHALNIFQIAQESSRLITLARSSKLQPSDYTGGTFSISNLGMNGIEDFTAIINPPQAAILAIGSTVPTPVVSSTGQIAVEQRMTVSLSCDHRVIDGFMGAKFLQTLKYFCENPMVLLLST